MTINSFFSKYICIFLFLLAPLWGCSQINFENAYYVNNSGERINGFIQNMDWSNNPNGFKFKMNLEAKTTDINIDDAIEFGFTEGGRYIRATVDIDYSRKDIDNLSNSRLPEYINKTVFLKELVNGTANLYFFRDREVQQFFLRFMDSEITPLVHTKYKVSQSRIAEYNGFRYQLSSVLDCDRLNTAQIEKVNYNEADLSRLILTYNECQNPGATPKIEEKKDLFNLWIRPGLNLSSLEINLPDTDGETLKFERKPVFRLGLEIEYILPFNKNKWSLFAEPTYQSYSDEKGNSSAQVNYSSIEVPLGVRHLMFLNDRMAIFINGAIYFDISGNSELNRYIR